MAGGREWILSKAHRYDMCADASVTLARPHCPSANRRITAIRFCEPPPT